MKITIITFFLLLVFGSMDLFSQDFTFYVKIADPALIQETVRDEKTNNLVVKSKNAALDAILKKYKFKKFHQAFPTAVRPSLRKLYLVVCNDKKLGDDLREKLSDIIPGVYELEGGLTYTPNDYSLVMEQTNLDLINAKDAWDICKDIPKVDIGISDCYFDLNHEDLNMTLFEGSNSTAHYHGTAVAGCIAAITDNDTGLASVAFDTELFVSTNYAIWGGDSAVLALAQAGYRVINCSWWSHCQPIPDIDTLYQDIRNIYNTIVVFGIGNRTSANHCGASYNPTYPASYSSNVAVTSVGHINDYGTQGSPSNNWKDVHEEVIGDSATAHHHHPTVDICAPGYNVPTTDIMGLGGSSNGNYANVWGTSFAAPQVSGTVGLILSVNPCLTANEAVDVLLNNTDDSLYDIPENEPYIGRLGTGRLDVFASVDAAAESATTYLEGQTLTGNQDIEANYAIQVIDNVTIASGATIDFITRKEVTINSNFEVVSGAELTIDVNVNNVISCN